MTRVRYVWASSGPGHHPDRLQPVRRRPQVRVWFAASYLPQRLQIPAAAAFIVVGALAVWWATAIQRTSTGDR